MTSSKKALVKIPLERVEGAILLIRGEKVILDSDLAALYGVSTTRLNEQVKRNKNRFPTDFLFQLTKAEWKSLISQFATSNAGRGGRRLCVSEGVDITCTIQLPKQEQEEPILDC